MIQDGVTVEDPRGGFVEWDDIVGELLSKATEHGEAILKEIRELKKELQQMTARGRENLERDWDADLNGF